MITRTAACSCGNLKAVCAGELEKVSLCHCLACQRRSGSAFGVAAFFARDRVRIDGRSAVFARTSDSGANVTFHFCPACGSTVYWESTRKPDLIAVALGAFTDPTFPAPTQSVHERTAHAWAIPNSGIGHWF